MTLAQFERLIDRAWKAYDKFEKKVEYRDEHTHEIIKGQEEYNKYSLLREEVQAHVGQFPYKSKEVNSLP